jgi:hypothetical protein
MLAYQGTVTTTEAARTKVKSKSQASIKFTDLYYDYEEYCVAKYD